MTLGYPGTRFWDGPIEDLLRGAWQAKGASHYDAPDAYDWYARRGAYDRAPLSVTGGTGRR
jgi:hypothetical protein